MSRALSSSASPRPLYREILRDALSLAWKEKRFWPLALLAVFLQTGGVYDVFLLSVRHALQAPLVRDGYWRGYFTRVAELDWVGKFALTQSILLSLAIIILILFFSVVAQGTLVGCLDRGQLKLDRAFQQILQRAAKRVVPLAVLNALMLGIVGLGSMGLRVVSEVAFSIPGGNIMFICVAIVYLAVLVIATSLHLFALNGIMADGMTLHEALTHAWDLLRKAWLTILEAALGMMLIGMIVFGAAIIVALFAGLPVFGFFVASLYLGMPKIFVIVNVVMLALVAFVILLGALFAINFQYATWNRLYRRAIEGTAHSKIGRLVRSVVRARPKK